MKKQLKYFFLLFLFLFSCKGESQSPSYTILKSTVKKENQFFLKTPTDKKDYSYTYDDAKLFIKQTADFQELNLISSKSNLKINKKLEDYYESADLHFYLYENKANSNEAVLIIEGDDYYSSVFGVYYILENTISKLDFLSFQQNNPEKYGHQALSANLHKTANGITCEFFVGKKNVSNKAYKISTREKENTQIAEELSDLKASWAVICANELTELDINKNKGFLSLYDFNAIYINLKIEKLSENEYVLKYASVSSQQDYYKDRLSIIDDHIDKNKPIGKLILLENGKARLEWVGLYNLKKQKLDFVGNDFLLIKENGGKTPLILEKCE